MKKIPIQAAVCIFYNEDRQILLLNRKALPFGFGLVGGKVDLMKESVIAGLQREIMEEIGIPTSANKLTWLGDMESVSGMNVSVFKYDVPITTNIRLSSEHSGYLWTALLDGIPLAGNTDKFFNLYRLDSSLHGFDDTMPFGKYKGHLITTIYNNNPSYLLWLHENTEYKLMHKVIKSAKLKIKNDRDEANAEEWRRTEPQRQEEYCKSLLASAEDTPYGKAVHIGTGVYRVIDNEGNSTGKLIESDWGSWSIYNPEDD